MSSKPIPNQSDIVSDLHNTTLEEDTFLPLVQKLREEGNNSQTFQNLLLKIFPPEELVRDMDFASIANKKLQRTDDLFKPITRLIGKIQKDKTLPERTKQILKKITTKYEDYIHDVCHHKGEERVLLLQGRAKLFHQFGEIRSVDQKIAQKMVSKDPL